MGLWQILAAFVVLVLIGGLALYARKHARKNDLDQQNLTTYLGMAAMSGRSLDSLPFKQEVKTLIVTRGWGQQETQSRLAHAVVAIKDSAPHAHGDALVIGRQILSATHPPVQAARQLH